nr:Hsp20/alpha crystallin family protein [Streptomyces sp. GESEQ-4]
MDGEKVEADLTDGILTVRLPKSGTSKARPDLHRRHGMAPADTSPGGAPCRRQPVGYPADAAERRRGLTMPSTCWTGRGARYVWWSKPDRWSSVSSITRTRPHAPRESSRTPCGRGPRPYGPTSRSSRCWNA